jgi:hypothetical protein
MRFSEETLMAYADGELDADTHADIEAAMETNPDLADAIAIQRENRQALQSRLHAAFDGALTEEVPARLLDTAQSALPSATTALPTARETGRDATQTRLSPRGTPWQLVPRHWSVHTKLSYWGAIAVSLLIGVLVGHGASNRDEGAVSVDRGRMTARAELDTALSSQSGGAINRETGIRIGVSYLAKNGDYCRTFTLKDAQVLAGLACRRNAQWTIDALTPTKADASGAYRMAGAAVPALILGIVEDTIAGDPLDAEQESEAREHSWQR